MGYEFLEHTSDVRFKVENESLEGLFKDAAMAVFETAVELDTVDETVKFEIKLENKNLEELLYDFLEEIIFLKDAEYVVFKKVDLKIKGNYKLEAKFSGEKITPTKHKLFNDIKAVTWHEFSVKKINSLWVATVIVDI